MKKQKTISIEMSEREVAEIILEHLQGKGVVGKGNFTFSFAVKNKDYQAYYLFQATEEKKSDKISDLKEKEVVVEKEVEKPVLPEEPERLGI